MTAAHDPELTRTTEITEDWLQSIGFDEWPTAFGVAIHSEHLILSTYKGFWNLHDRDSNDVVEIPSPKTREDVLTLCRLLVGKTTE